MTSVIDVIGLIDAILGPPTPEQVARERERRTRDRLVALGIQPPAMGGIKTKGCGQCGGTMWWTVEPDGSGQWICGSCGTVE